MALTSQLPPSSHCWVDCHIHYIPHKHCNLLLLKLCPPTLPSSQIKPASPTFTFILVSVGGSTTQKFTSHMGLLPSLSPESATKFGFFVQLHPPQPSLCSGSLTQTVSTALWLFFLSPGLHSPQSNVSKMQIWPRHFSAWILSTVTMHFKFSSGLKGLPWPLLTSGLSLTHTCAAIKCFQFFKRILMVHMLCDVFVIPSASPSFFTWLPFILKFPSDAANRSLCDDETVVQPALSTMVTRSHMCMDSIHSFLGFLLCIEYCK